MENATETSAKAPPDLDAWLFWTALLTLILGIVDLLVACVLWLTAQPASGFYGGLLLATALILAIFAFLFYTDAKISEPFTREKWGLGESSLVGCIIISVFVTAPAGLSVLNQTPMPLIGWVPLVNAVLAFVAICLYGSRTAPIDSDH